MLALVKLSSPLTPSCTRSLLSPWLGEFESDLITGHSTITPRGCSDRKLDIRLIKHFIYFFPGAVIPVTVA